MTTTHTHPTPFMLSIEGLDGTTKRHGYHLGTDLRVAEACAEDLFRARRDRVKTVALLDAKGVIVDVFDGTWFNKAEVEA